MVSGMPPKPSPKTEKPSSASRATPSPGSGLGYTLRGRFKVTSTAIDILGTTTNPCDPLQADLSDVTPLGDRPFTRQQFRDLCSGLP